MPIKTSNHGVSLTRIYAWFSALISEDSALLADLVAHGFPVDTPHPLRHTTALMEATRLGRTNIVLWLLEHGAAPAFLCGLPLGTPLHCAIRRQHWAIAQALLDAMPSAAIRDAYGRTPLHLLCMDEADPLHMPHILTLAKDLLAKGCPIETLDHEGTTALHHCAINDAAELAEMLLDHGANPNCMIPDTKVNPLLIAALEQNMNLSSLLLHHGADPYQATREGVTAISVMPTILRLLGHRALGRMPLHQMDASRTGSMRIH